jgi:chaperonin GroES
MNLQPLGDRLIVEVLDEEETTVSGIVLPDTAVIDSACFALFSARAAPSGSPLLADVRRFRG